jgi:FkbM family methyltransferase
MAFPSSSLFRRRMRQASRRALIGLVPQVYWGFRRWRRGDEELELTLLPLLCSRERVSVDVGANFGMYTARMIALSRRCVAFEPIPAMARMLARGFGRTVDVHGVALSDRTGMVELRVPDLDTGYATIDPANRLTSRREVPIDRVEVPMARLDDFGLDDVGFVKVDVEGHEEAVLRGAEATLARCRPNVIVEVEDRHNPGSVARVLGWMRERGYAAFGIREGVLEDLARFDLTEHQAGTPTDRYVRNVVFLPDEHRSRLADTIASVLRRR